jgi:hypothetical protein
MQLPTTRQIQIIASLLSGRGVPNIDTQNLSQPWRKYYGWITNWITEDPDKEEYYLDWFTRLLARQDEDETNNLTPIIAAMENPVTGYLPASEMLQTLPDYGWLWEKWIPRGLWTLLVAEPGTGKSYVALDIARRISSGSAFPDGTPISDGGGSVLWVDAENRPSILKQRLGVWAKTDLRRFHLMLADPDLWAINLDGFVDRDRFLDMLWIIRPTLVIVDSYGAATERGENTKEDVQRLLAFLNQVTVHFDCGLLVVHHLRKAPGGQKTFLPMTLNSVRGSSHIGAMASIVVGMQWIPTAAQPDPNGPRKLWCLKSNLALKAPPLGVTLEPHPSDPEVAAVHYGDAPEPYQKPTKAELCAEWLLDTLHGNGEPMNPNQLLELAESEGFSRATLYRAYKHLGDQITDTQGRQHPENKWALPGMLEG